MARYISIFEDLKEGKSQFVDLNLPSGIKWALMDVSRYFSLEQAFEQSESIPTIEQFKELFTNCRFRLIARRGNTALHAESPNGSYILFDCKGHLFRRIIGYVYYWVRDLNSNTLKVLKMKNNIDYAILEPSKLKTKSIKIKRVQSA